MVAPVHKMSQSGQQIRQESAELSIAAIFRPSEPSGMDGEGCQSITVFVSELATVNSPWPVEINRLVEWPARAEAIFLAIELILAG